jgi:hypothetical protein
MSTFHFPLLTLPTARTSSNSRGPHTYPATALAAARRRPWPPPTPPRACRRRPPRTVKRKHANGSPCAGTSPSRCTSGSASRRATTSATYGWRGSTRTGRRRRVLSASGPTRPRAAQVARRSHEDLTWGAARATGGRTLVAALFPDIPHPILLMGGLQGTGKTTAATFLAGLFDPSTTENHNVPKDPESWAMAANGSWGVVVDNVSHIPDWWSDALCKTVTGSGWLRRKLYTDSELSVMSFRRVVVLTSIDAGASRRSGRSARASRSGTYLGAPAPR